MAWASGGRHVGRPKADGIGKHPGGPVAEAQVGTHACVCVCVCMHMCVHAHLGSSKASFLKVSRKRKEPPPLQKHRALPSPLDTHQELEEGEKMCESNWILSTAVSPCVARGWAQRLCLKT